MEVVGRWGVSVLKRNVLDLYFVECLIWTIQHLYDYFNKEHRNEHEIDAKRLTIIKYMMDTVTSHNDFSRKIGSINIQQCTFIGLVSSLLGLKLIWK
jgi:hypothetical protein